MYLTTNLAFLVDVVKAVPLAAFQDCLQGAVVWFRGLQARKETGWLKPPRQSLAMNYEVDRPGQALTSSLPLSLSTTAVGCGAFCTLWAAWAACWVASFRTAC